MVGTSYLTDIPFEPLCLMFAFPVGNLFIIFYSMPEIDVLSYGKKIGYFKKCKSGCQNMINFLKTFGLNFLRSCGHKKILASNNYGF
jgi:hypothetical protein